MKSIYKQEIDTDIDQHYFDKTLEALNLTQSEFAQIIGYSEQAIIRCKNKNKSPGWLKLTLDGLLAKQNQFDGISIGHLSAAEKQIIIDYRYARHQENLISQFNKDFFANETPISFTKNQFENAIGAINSAFNLGCYLFLSPDHIKGAFEKNVRQDNNFAKKGYIQLLLKRVPTNSDEPFQKHKDPLYQNVVIKYEYSNGSRLSSKLDSQDPENYILGKFPYVNER